MTTANVRRNLRDQNRLILLSLKELLGRLKHIVVRKQSQKKLQMQTKVFADFSGGCFNLVGRFDYSIKPLFFVRIYLVNFKGLN